MADRVESGRWQVANNGTITEADFNWSIPVKALTSPLEAVAFERAIPERYSRWGFLGRLTW